MDEDEKGASSIYGFNPETRRYVLKNGPTWARLVKRGTVQDAALVAAWASAKEATRQGQVARAKEARALGLGICGGVLPEATRHIVPAADLSEDFRALPERSASGRKSIAKPAPPPVARNSSALPGAAQIAGSQGARELLRNIALENREALCREDITREEAEELLRKAYTARLSR